MQHAWLLLRCCPCPQPSSVAAPAEAEMWRAEVHPSCAPRSPLLIFSHSWKPMGWTCLALDALVPLVSQLFSQASPMTAHCGKRFRATHFNKPLKTANSLTDPPIPCQPPKPRTEFTLEPTASPTEGLLLLFSAILVPCGMDAWILQPWASFGTQLPMTSEWWQLAED